MSRKHDCWRKNDEYCVDLKRRKTSYRSVPPALTQSELENALKIHELIYSSQKKVNEKTSICTAASSSSPRCSKTLMKDVPTESSPSTNDQYNIDFQRSTAKDISALYDKTVSRLKDTLARDAVSICLTFDFDNTLARMGRSYIALSAHYINQDLDMKHVLLEFLAVPDSSITSWLLHIKRVVRKYEIETKIMHIVAKYSPHKEKLFNKLILSNLTHSSWCYRESLNQIVLNALTPLDGLFDKMKAIESYINKNKFALEYFCTHQARMGGAVQVKLLERLTRQCWKSKYSLLQWFKASRESITACLEAVENDCPAITEDEWTVAEQLYLVLRPFEEVLTWIADENLPSLPGSMIIILTNSLQCISSQMAHMTGNNEFKEAVVEVLNSMKTELESLFSVESHEFCNSLGLCTFLDPRFKNNGFQNDTAVSMIKKHVHKLIMDMIVNNESGTRKQPEGEEIMAWAVHDRFLDTVQSSAEDRATRELNMYIDADVLPRKGPDGRWNDPAEWWRRHTTIYPRLSKIYRSQGVIVGTSIECERLISCAGKVLEQYKTKATMEEIAFLNINKNV